MHRLQTPPGGALGTQLCLWGVLENPGMVWVGRDLQSHPVPPLPLSPSPMGSARAGETAAGKEFLPSI